MYTQKRVSSTVIRRRVGRGNGQDRLQILSRKKTIELITSRNADDIKGGLRGLIMSREWYPDDGHIFLNLARYHEDAEIRGMAIQSLGELVELGKSGSIPGIWNYDISYMLMLALHSKHVDTVMAAAEQIGKVVPEKLGVAYRFTDDPVARAAVRMSAMKRPEYVH